ncbi:MAG TPA: DUF2469 family protein [Euzebyales bacterium]|nr:DUF2469 family protein [Euzebyales bacterium]
MSSSEELEQYETDMELALYREYRDVVGMFRYAVETERRFYLANEVEVVEHDRGPYEIELRDAWVWDMYRPARFVTHVRVLSYRDVNIERIAGDAELPGFPPTSIAD